MTDQQMPPFWHDEQFKQFRKTRPAEGGVRARSKRGKFVETWWAQRWLLFLDQFDLGARLSRGKTYARKGQVLDIAIEKGAVTASVQGSMPKPYSVFLQMTQIGKDDWIRLARVLQSKPKFAALLFAGDMPNDIEDAFKTAKLSLFPLKGTDFSSKCSCPDWSNPCKHIAAVYYLLGEEFDRDPFLIFKLRGLGRDELLALLVEGSERRPPERTKRRLPERTERRRPADIPDKEPTEHHESFGIKRAEFWRQYCDFEFNFNVPIQTGLLIRRLKHFPFWKGSERFDEMILPLYEEATNRARKLLDNQ